METGRERVEREKRLLAEIAEEFPDVEVTRVFGGLDAVPKGTPIVRAANTEALLRQLREQRDQAEADGS